MTSLCDVPPCSLSLPAAHVSCVVVAESLVDEARSFEDDGVILKWFWSVNKIVCCVVLYI